MAAGFPLYRISASSVSVRTFARRQNREKKNTANMPISAPFHQYQLPAMPRLATRPLTARGVSAAKVVATMDVPSIHQGMPWPEAKYSFTDEVDFFEWYSPNPTANTT